MVKVIMVAMDNAPVTLEFVDIYDACRVMKDLSDSVVGGCAFTVSFPKEEKSRFVISEKGEISKLC